MWVLATGAGALIAWADTAAELPTPPADSVVRELPQWAAPPPLPYVWTPAALDWTIPPPADPPRLSRLQFASRWTVPEQVAIEGAADAHPDTTTRYTVRVVTKALDRANDVDVSDPRTIEGTTLLVDLLVSLGVILPADRDDRLDAILATP